LNIKQLTADRHYKKPPPAQPAPGLTYLSFTGRTRSSHFSCRTDYYSIHRIKALKYDSFLLGFSLCTYLIPKVSVDVDVDWNEEERPRGFCLLSSRGKLYNSIQEGWHE
jgi:hypothetical protein